MTSTWHFPALAGVLAIGGLVGFNPGEARAQYTMIPGRTIVVPAAPVATTRTYVVPAAPVMAGQTVVVPTRRAFRSQRRYVAQRPTYAGRPAITFAPYSDRYNTNAFAPPRPTIIDQVPPR